MRPNLIFEKPVSARTVESIAAEIGGNDISVVKGSLSQDLTHFEVISRDPKKDLDRVIASIRKRLNGSE